jgi:hypothetical protein
MTNHPLPDLFNLDDNRLFVNELPKEFTIKCELNQVGFIVNEDNLKKYPVLAAMVRNNYLEARNREIMIGIKECNPETLELVIDYHSSQGYSFHGGRFYHLGTNYTIQ